MTGVRYRGTLDFQLGGGGKDFVGTHITSAKSFMAGVQGPLKSPGSSRSLWCSLVLS